MKNKPLHSSYNDLPPAAVYATIAGVLIAMFMGTLDQTIVATAMPKIIEDLHGFEHYAAVVSAYMVTSTTSMPIAGKISDIFGRKPLLLAAVALFIIASILCGLSQSMEQLVIFRAIQGIGGGTLQIMAFSTIADLFPPRDRGKIVGTVSSVFGLSSIAGPVLGGFLTEAYGWRSIFYVNIPVGLLALVVLVLFFPEVRAPKQGKIFIDYSGAVFLVASIVPLLLALNWGGRDYQWGSLTILGLLAMGMFFVLLFLRAEKFAKDPILPLMFFHNSIISLALLLAAMLSACMLGISFFIPLFVQSILGKSALESGTMLIPMTISMVVSSIISGQLITKFGRYKFFALAGTTMATVGVFFLAEMDISTSSFSLVFITVITGFGLGASLPVFNLAVQNAVEVEKIGVATATVQFMRSIGGCLGVAIFGSILTLKFVPSFHQAIPLDIFQKMPPAHLLTLDNPQAFTRADHKNKIETIFSLYGTHADEVLAQVKTASKIGITSALQTVFMGTCGVLFLGAFLTLFLKEIPLRRSNRSSRETDLALPSQLPSH